MGTALLNESCPGSHDRESYTPYQCGVFVRRDNGRLLPKRTSNARFPWMCLGFIGCGLDRHRCSAPSLNRVYRVKPLSATIVAAVCKLLLISARFRSKPRKITVIPADPCSYGPDFANAKPAAIRIGYCVDSLVYADYTPAGRPLSYRHGELVIPAAA